MNKLINFYVQEIDRCLGEHHGSWDACYCFTDALDFLKKEISL